MRIEDEYTAATISGSNAGSLDAETARLARLISALAPQDGTYSQRIPGLYVSRYSRTDPDTVKTFYSTSLLIVAQGAKTITAGQEVYQFNKSRMILLPVALPVAMQLTQASPAEPYLSVKLELDPQRIGELSLKLYPRGLPPVRKRNKGYIANSNLNIINAVTRLVECLQSPGDVDLLAPLVLEEIMIRVLRSPIGAQLVEMGFAESDVQRVAKVIAWLRDNFSRQMKVAELAELVHMSASSFHVHFKSVTSMSPLQYQKALRLHEARRLMLAGPMDATTACRLVGYVSDSQFSRDYRRFFGSPPSRDIARLRQRTQLSD
ncbi:AraC family transcriptional regulator [Paenibacillus sp. S150]|uniref:AraC family transcriptional regulator n=1 Tax=Paenibacillus sp. S150 TaxID=2749826 RepID=UPI001C57F81A|nr:AraC family transcriptional regulator [Paenibacillus sp. S150]MBW4081229.1 AraC family transcriptional regulator [Paenibacillus sp. S150]